MILIKITDIKKFMEKLFVDTIFDTMLTVSAEIAAASTWSMSGAVNTSYYTAEELEETELSPYVSWSSQKSIIFSIIKGKKSPLMLKIVLTLPKANMESFIAKSCSDFDATLASSLYINIKFDANGLFLTTGASYNTFTLDKALENQWDNATKRLLLKHSINFE